MDFFNNDEWLEFSASAWDAAGRPPGLDPNTLLSNPIEFDHSYYNYFQRRYIDIWLDIHAHVNPDNGFLLKRESIFFKDAWQRNFDWDTIWKQILPLLVYGTTLGSSNDVLIELASWYCIGQAIPSMVVDRILDNDTTLNKVDSDVAFCMLCYGKALKGLRSLEIPNKERIENVFLNLTYEMYEKMYTEYNSRYNELPEFPSDAIQKYLLPGSRLLSSVFFGILPIWAYALTNKKSSDKINESLIKLRMVRQLNDEILDAKADLNHGLLTLPWIFALEEKPKLRELINILWKKKKGKTTIEECYQILESSLGRKRAMAQSINLLSESMNISRECFLVENAFEITLLHNIRLGLLNWLEQVNFTRNPDDIYSPNIPQEIILDIKHTVEPVPGSGVIVYNSSKQVLLTLVLKRGMLRWELPAGVSKTDESFEETAKRETLEETGKEIEICDAIATCWHYSRILNKGWMGLFFKGEIINKNEDDHNEISIVTPQAFSQSKFNMSNNPELYHSTNLSNCDFDKILSMCEYNYHPTVHESVIASGFVDWKQIPEGRMHPLHRELLEAIETGNTSMYFLHADADKDREIYNEDKLYIKK